MIPDRKLLELEWNGPVITGVLKDPCAPYVTPKVFRRLWHDICMFPMERMDGMPGYIRQFELTLNIIDNADDMCRWLHSCVRKWGRINWTYFMGIARCWVDNGVVAFFGDEHTAARIIIPTPEKTIVRPYRGFQYTNQWPDCVKQIAVCKDHLDKEGAS